MNTRINEKWLKMHFFFCYFSCVLFCMNHTVVVALNIFINLNIMCDLGVNHTKMEMLNCSSLANDPIKKPKKITNSVRW